MQEDLPTHRVQVHNLRGAWTPLNRDVAFTLYDGYAKAKALKKNLSSEALHGFKVDTSQSPQVSDRLHGEKFRTDIKCKFDLQNQDRPCSLNARAFFGPEVNYIAYRTV